MAAKKSAKPVPRPTIKTPEDVLRDYFLKEDIAFLYKEKKLPLPVGSAHEFLLPDFYLPQLGLPVEIMHHWEDPKFRPRNLVKLELYSKADIPCIFIYPKDLPALDKLFAQKLQEAKRALAFQHRDKQDINFSLMVAIVCILLGVPLSMLRYTKYLGWIAIAYGATLLLMRHPHLVIAVLKRAGQLSLVLLSALGRSAGRLLVLGWHGFTILCRLFWKLTKLLTIYAWIIIRATALAAWWVLVRIWFGLLTTVVWLWHAFLWLCTRIWRGIQWLSVHGFRSIGIGFRYLWIGVRAAAKMFAIGVVYLWRGIAYVLRNVWRGFLVALQAFGSGIYQAKHSLQERAKERKLAAQEAAKEKREGERVAKAAARAAATKPKSAKQKSAKKGKRKAA